MQGCGGGGSRENPPPAAQQRLAESFWSLSFSHTVTRARALSLARVRSPSHHSCTREFAAGQHPSAGTDMRHPSLECSAPPFAQGWQAADARLLEDHAATKPPLLLMALPSDLISQILTDVAESRRQGNEAFGAIGKQKSLQKLTSKFSEKHKLLPGKDLSARVLTAPRAAKLAQVNAE